MEHPKGGGHAIRPCLCMFRKGRPLFPWLYFGVYFGVILGPKIATVLLFGGPNFEPVFERSFLYLRGSGAVSSTSAADFSTGGGGAKTDF